MLKLLDKTAFDKLKEAPTLKKNGGKIFNFKKDVMLITDASKHSI